MKKYQGQFLILKKKNSLTFVITLVLVFVTGIGCEEKRENLPDLVTISSDLQKEKEKNKYLLLVNEAYHKILITLNNELDLMVDLENDISNISPEDIVDEDYVRDFAKELDSKIDLLEQSFENSKARIKELEDLLQKSNLKNNRQGLRLDDLKNMIQVREDKIDKLNERINTLLTENDELKEAKKANEQRITSLEQENSNIRKENNTVYIVKKHEDYLLNNRIIIKEKPFLRPSKFYLSKSFDLRFFNSMDKREVKSIEIPSSKNVRIISSHPRSSYQIVRYSNSTMLLIRELNNFWSLSDKLVISYK
ncbi:MAG: hypothetical protein FH748_07130 [Balneolaceae bacterium]|nr:hypothetical protein [Balneolaceae bacterium]